MARTQAKVVYFFQVVFLLFAVVAVLKFQAGFIISSLIVVCVWWAGLAMFAGSVVGGEFRYERFLANSAIDACRSSYGKRCAQTLFFLVYWPIFIPKRVYFWSLIGIASTYYVLRFLANR